MQQLSVGDTVRFLSTVGGGKVKGFQSKQIVIVEDEHGFDLPVLISECVVVEPADTLVSRSEKTASADISRGSAGKPGKPGKTEITEITGTEKREETTHVRAFEEEVEETPGGDELTACLAYLPMDIKNLSSTSYECYFVNDSNYYLYFNYMNRENNAWTSRFTGLVEPNTKIFVEEFDKTSLNDIEKVSVQFIAFKRNKPFKFKNPCSVELRIDTVKFYKLHSFRENDYFDEDALVYYIVQGDMPEKELLVSAGDLERAMKEKRRADAPARRRVGQKPEKSPVVEVDLHINQLLDTTAGMDNAAILEYQLQKFNEAMKEHLPHKQRKLVFIHGKGDGVLRNALIKELKKNYPSCYYQDASFQEYGYGATMVTIK